MNLIRKDYPRYPNHPRAPYYYPGGGGLEARRVTRLVTPALDDDGMAVGELVLPNTAGSFLLQLKSRGPGWFRLYGSLADMVLDEDRDIDDLPTTPIVVDANFAPSNPVATLLDDAAWVAGPDCDGAASFGGCTDASLTTRWTTGTTQAAGDIFSVDFGSIISLDTIVLDASESGVDYPGRFSVETSVDGVAWSVEEASVTGAQITTVTFSQTIATQYLRCVITDPSPFNPIFWSIVTFSAYLASEDNLDLRLRTRYADGIPAFNRDDKARPKLYYKFIGPLEPLSIVTAGTFLNGKCCPWGFDCDPPFSFCDGKEPKWVVDVDWFGSNLLSAQSIVGVDEYRWRYYQNFSELRPYSADTRIARANITPSEMVGLRFEFTAHRDAGVEQSQSFSTLICAYVSNVASVLTAATLPHIRGGLIRASDSTVQAFIEWRDDTGTWNPLDTGSSVTMDIDDVVVVTGGIYANGALAPTFRVYVDDVLEAEAAVPDDLLELTTVHTRCGLFMTATPPPGATLAFGALGLTSLSIGEVGHAVIDVGYVPVEIPGGSIIYGGF